MGSPTSEPERARNEGPQHKVEITKGFWLGKYEVTCSQWEQFMGSTGLRSKKGDNPISGISWDDCQAFIRKLTNRYGSYKFRLPTEAQWE